MKKISLTVGILCGLTLGLFNACSLDISPISDPSELTEGGQTAKLFHLFYVFSFYVRKPLVLNMINKATT